MAQDFDAQGMAAKAQKTANFEVLRRDILHRANAAAKQGNIRTRGVVASPPTVTVAQASAPTSPYAQVPSSVGAVSAYDPYVKFVGGWRILDSSAVYCAGATRLIGSPTGGTATGGSGAVAYNCATRAIFNTDAPIISFGIRCTVLNGSNQSPKFRIIVDGQYITTAGYSNTATTRQYVTLDFSSVGGRKPRRIEVELQGGTANDGVSNGIQSIGPFYVTPLDSIWAPSAESIGPRLMVAGDSYTLGPIYSQVTESMMGDGWARILGDWLGLDDTVCSGVGGTGWLARSSGADRPNMLDRITDFTDPSNDHDILCIAMGINDGILDGQTQGGVLISSANVQTRVSTVLATYRASKPTTPIVVLGPWRRPNLSGMTAYEAAISAGVSALGDSRISFQPTISENWQNGTGKAGSTTGDGNADVYIVSDGTHPTIAGHEYLGRRAARAFLAGLRAMPS